MINDTSHPTIREAVVQHADELRDELLRLALNAENESVRLAAIKELHDRAFGRSAQLPVNAGATELQLTISADDASLL